ncbi:hypothetical protein C8A00DRAFT_16811 [Chaetomidium leptoderma]|uniref:Dienelactone hydrolase domain-containing protein n=1 Tax=Chaetomidium leptoderma TaxID=669021 RepID=A0AAN6VHX7_9PEZI|nr:hypothetical protein C8A00DRAFT_16811 [Chaetomidium leptoderma]
MASAPLSTCCLRASLWEGTPTGIETTLPNLPNNPTYVAKPPASSSAPSSPSSRVAILMVHDLLGWTFPNARDADATVYLPDFFGGEVVSFEAALAGRFDELDLPGILARQARAIREPEIVAFARALRASGRYDKVGAVGFCYGGWAVFRLGAREFVVDDDDDDAGAAAGGRGPLVDCISAGHPSLLTEQDVDEVAVPVQLVAPEVDPVFTPEMKLFAFQTLQKNGVAFDYQHLPGVEHACLIRGDVNKKGEREAMVRGKSAAVAWFRQWLHDE